jgi:16S rRNA (uracil1498-N3)-methyltransferase
MLEGPEAHHLGTVSRLRPGDQVCLFNGNGHEYPALIQTVSRHSISLDILRIETPLRELGFQLEVAAPLPKGDRAQFLLEKLTELGVTAFVPLRTRRSVVHQGEQKIDKLQRHVIEASKQCGRNRLLHVADVTDWKTYLERPDVPALSIIAHPEGTAPVWPQAQDCAFAVGPEGGFTEDEVAEARCHGWQVVSLGPRILRIETAALFFAAGAVAVSLRSP